MSRAITVVFKDTGSFNAVWPVVEYLRERCSTWTWWFFAASVAARRLAALQIPYFSNPDEFDHLECNLVISGTSSTDADQNFLEVKICQKATAKKIPIVAVSDVWMSALRITDNPGVEVSVVTSIDDPSTAALASLLPTGVKVVTTGNPAFDQLVSFDYAVTRTELRQQLGLKSTDQLILCLGGYNDQTTEMLQLLLQAISILNSNQLVVAPRPHPKVMTDPGFESEATAIRNLKANFTGRWLDTSEVKSTELLLAAADLVVGNYSTLQIQACHLAARHHSPVCLHIILSQDLVWLKHHFCGLAETVPAATLGAAAEVYSNDPMLMAQKILDLLYDVTTRKNILRQCQTHFPLDGSATQKVAEQVISLLGA